MSSGITVRLAVAFSLLNTYHGTTVWITKNLRFCVCEDCYAVTKLIFPFVMLLVQLVIFSEMSTTAGDRGSDHAALDWPTRLKIIRGVVRGVAYLHAELTSLDAPHGNLKSGNILLTDDYEPLVADYGFIGLVNPAQAPNVLFAYKSPEAVLHHTVGPKSDVYCLGIVILEILTGKFPSQYLNNTKGGTEVVHWTKSAIAEKREAELLDPAVSGSLRDALEDMVKLLKVGVTCADADPELRPEMKEVVAMVEEIAPASPRGGAEDGEGPRRPTPSSTFKEAYNGESSESPRIERTESMERGSMKRNGTYVMLPSRSFK